MADEAEDLVAPRPMAEEDVAYVAEPVESRHVEAGLQRPAVHHRIANDVAAVRPAIVAHAADSAVKVPGPHCVVFHDSA